MYFSRPKQCLSDGHLKFVCIRFFYVFCVSLSFVITFVCVKFSERVIKNYVPCILVIFLPEAAFLIF